MIENNEMRQYDFIEGIDFSGLTGKAIDKAPGTVGKSDAVVSSFRGWNGVAPLEVADIEAFYGDNPGPEPTPGPEPAPEPTQNDSAQTQTANNIADAAAGGSGYTAGEGETINNFTIPAGAPKTMTVTGPVQDGATITNNSSKGLTLVNTSEEPTTIVVDSPNAVIYPRGQYENIYVTGKGISAASGQYAQLHGDVNIEPETAGNVTVSANFIGDEPQQINYAGTNTVDISNANTTETSQVEINAPNGSVKIGGKYDEVTATVSDNTLELKNGFHTKKLVVKKGRVIFNGIDANDFANEIELAEGVVMEPVSYEITNASIAGFSKNGVSNVVEDIVSNSRVGFGMFANGKYRYNLNGHSVSLKGGTAAAMLLRGNSPYIEINGPGKLVESSGTYGIWASKTGTTVVINGGDYEAYTHVLYAEHGTIIVNGGSFKLLNENPELDPKGHCKFLLNCLDANYQSGDAKIIVTGGKFYNFDPSEAYCEPGGQSVSFVDKSKYAVEESVEEGVPVFTVVPLNFEGNGEPIEGGEDHNW